MADQENNASESDNKKSAGSKAAGDGSALTKAERVRLQLKRVLAYAMVGFSPVVAVLALGVAVSAITGNQSGKAQISKDAAEIESLKASLSASKLELEKLKMSAAIASKENGLLNERLKKQDELLARVVQNVTPIQTKLKISPTLEAQLSPAASGVVAAPVAPPAHPAVAPARPEIAKPAKPKAAEAHAPVPTKPHAKSPPPASGEPSAAAPGKQLSPQVKAMKEAIERFNKQ